MVANMGLVSRPALFGGDLGDARALHRVMIMN